MRPISTAIQSAFHVLLFEVLRAINCKFGRTRSSVHMLHYPSILCTRHFPLSLSIFPLLRSIVYSLHSQSFYSYFYIIPICRADLHVQLPSLQDNRHQQEQVRFPLFMFLYASFLLFGSSAGAFSLYSKLDSRNLATALGTSTGCVSALNTIVKCDQRISSMASSPESYLWKVKDLIVLCTTDCIDSAQQ